MIPPYIFCQCMKPWKICANQKKSYRIDIRDLISIYNMPSLLNKNHLNYDFVNRKFLPVKFVCRFDKYDDMPYKK
jgi:hypothetical protein